MEPNFADLLSDAFSESTVPSLPDGALDFENINFDEKLDEEDVVSQESSEEDGAAPQEASDHSVALETIDTSEDGEDEDRDEIAVEDEELCGAKDVEENFRGVGFNPMKVEGASQEDYTSSSEELEDIECVSGEDEEVEEEDRGAGGSPGDLLKSVQCRDDSRADNKEAKSFAKGRPLAPEGPAEPQVRNWEQGERESEEVFYFGDVPGIKDDGIEEEEEEEEKSREDDGGERQKDSSDSECKGVSIETEAFLRRSPGIRQTKASLEFPEVAEQNLQDLIAEVDTEEHAETMKDFSGDEYQAAGESFAEYPTDLPSCEYADERGENEGVHLDLASENRSEVNHTILPWTRSEEEEDEGYLYSRDLEMETETLVGLNSSAVERRAEVEDEKPRKDCDDEDEGSESDSYSSSDDEEPLRRRDDESSDGFRLQFPDNDYNKLRSWTAEAFSSWSTSDVYRPEPAPFTVNWDTDVSRTTTALSNIPDQRQTPSSGVSPLECISTNIYSQTQKVGAKTTGSSSNHGSLDDGFFFAEPEALETSESGQLGDDEYEEERNWEQEKERIDAFFKFYNDSDSENGREERQVKVQFCTDSLLQVIHYDSDSSDRDSLSSSSDVEEDLSSAEASEGQQVVDDILQMMQSACQNPESNTAELTEQEKELSANTHASTRKSKCLHMMKVILRMTLVVLMGLLMFWFLTDQLNPVSIFKA